MAIFLYPPIQTSVTSAPISFVKDSLTTTVNEDTVVPGNSEPLPVKILNPNGLPFDFKVLMSERLFFNYAGVSNAGYTQLIASTANEIKEMTWFESSGQPMVVALGGVGVEVDKFVVPPGGFNGAIPMDIPAGSRVSIKQLNAEVLSSGIMIVANFYK